MVISSHVFNIAVFNCSFVLNCIPSLSTFLANSSHTFSIGFKSSDNNDQGGTLIFWDLNQVILTFDR